MKNPYLVLEVSQDASKAEIMKAQMRAMKKREYSLQEIQLATKQLLDPAKRLAADFLYPTKIKSKRIHTIRNDLTLKELRYGNINEDAFNSLK